MKRRVKVVYEPEDDVLNIWLSKKLYDHAEMEGSAIVHYTKNNEPVYLEILFASRLITPANKKTFREVKKHQSLNLKPALPVPHQVRKL